MAKEDTKRAMSEAAKDANAMRKLKSVGMGEKEFAAMKAKYGARAYDLISAAMFPGNVVKALGWKKFKKSSATIKEFIDKPLTPEQIEKVTGKKADNTRTQATSLKSNSRDDTKATMKQQRDTADKETESKKKAANEKKVADEKKRAEAEAKKKAEAERKATEEKAKKTNTSTPKSVSKSTTQVSATLKCQIEQETIDTKYGKKTIFTSSVTDLQGVTIPELPGATNDSLWGVTFDREASAKNPVGGGTTFLGAMQYDDTGVRNIALYALTKPEYKNIAQKFFNPGYEKALKDFQAYVKKEGNNKAYWQDSKEKTALLAYLKTKDRKYRTIFREEGKTNAPQFLQLQRDFASEIYLSQTKGRYLRIVEALKKHNMKPENLDPKIWSMVFASAIHQKTYLNSIVRVFETMQYTTRDKNGKKVTKTIKNLNSVEMLDAIATVDPSTFGTGSGKESYENAKKDFGKKHSATTCRELSIILDDPQILKEYENLMAQNVTKVNGRYYAKANAPTKTASNNVRTNNTARM